MQFNHRNVHISSKAIIGANVRIGDGTVIHDNVVIKDNSTICDNCTIGEPLAEYYSNRSYINPTTVIGENALIRSHAIIYCGSSFGHHLETGHRVIIRENSVVGDNCRIGSMSDLQGDLRMGNACQLHSSVHLCKLSQLGDFVFMYPFSVLTNDRYPPSMSVSGPKIGSYTQVGVHAIIIAGIEIGEHCLIAANASVAKDFVDHSFIVGSPAKRVSDVRELKDDDGNSLYPWKQRFSRGMPWAK